MARRKKQPGVKKDDVIPDDLQKGIVAQEITSDFVLEIYEKAKRARSKKKKDEYLAVAEELSKHIGKWLVE